METNFEVAWASISPTLIRYLTQVSEIVCLIACQALITGWLVVVFGLAIVTRNTKIRLLKWAL